MNPFFRLLFLFFLLSGFSVADNTPAWPVIAEAERLIAKNALFPAGRDGFLKRSNGKLLHYELPECHYLRDGDDWLVEICCFRRRMEGEGQWEPWQDARPKFSAWRVGVIRVRVPLSGVVGEWVDQNNFAGCTAPSESEVRQRLDTLGQNSISTEGTRGEPTKRKLQTARSEPTVTPTPRPEPPPAHGGIFRKDASGVLERAWPPAPASSEAEGVAVTRPHASQPPTTGLASRPPVKNISTADSSQETAIGGVSMELPPSPPSPSQGFSRRFMIAMIALVGLVAAAAIVPWLLERRKASANLKPY